MSDDTLLLVIWLTISLNLYVYGSIVDPQEGAIMATILTLIIGAIIGVIAIIT